MLGQGGGGHLYRIQSSEMERVVITLPCWMTLCKPKAKDATKPPRVSAGIHRSPMLVFMNLHDPVLSLEPQLALYESTLCGSLPGRVMPRPASMRHHVLRLHICVHMQASAALELGRVIGLSALLAAVGRACMAAQLHGA